jgi:hypothetical protein
LIQADAQNLIPHIFFSKYPDYAAVVQISGGGYVGRSQRWRALSFATRFWKSRRAKLRQTAKDVPSVRPRTAG